jgi:hypothetical protein
MINRNYKIQYSDGRIIGDNQIFYGGFPQILNEGKKAKKDYDGDGKVESAKDEYFGSKDKAIKKAMSKKSIKEYYDSDEVELVEELLESVFDDEDLELIEAILIEKKEKKWIQKAIKKEGSLRQSLKVKSGKNIPAAKLEKAAKKGGKMGKRARLALTLRKLNEARYDIPASSEERIAREDDPSTVGVDEMLKILKGGGHPEMAGQNGQRGVPPEIRKQAIQHLETIKGHPQGPIKNYSEEHPVYKEGKAAHDFFLKHFPKFGVEDAIADSHDIGRL